MRGEGKVKKKLIGVGGVVLFSILVPYVMTLMFGITKNVKGETDKVFEAENMGQTVVISTNGKKEKLDVEMFVPCALMAVADIDEEEEILKALAVILRTKILYSMQGLSSIDASDLDMEYVTYQSMEKKWKEDFSSNYNYLMKIVNNTSCQVMTYEGDVIIPYFHNVSAGATRTGEYPYLISAESEGDYESEDYLTMTYFTNKEFYEKICKEYQDVELSEDAPLETLQILERDDAGYVCSMQIGGKVITGESFADVFELKSTYFQVEVFNGNVRIATKGDGHGFGLSIGGCGIYAEAGWTYVQMLEHYFQGIEFTQY